MTFGSSIVPLQGRDLVFAHENARGLDVRPD